jgi:hypothetical protein
MKRVVIGLVIVLFVFSALSAQDQDKTLKSKIYPFSKNYDKNNTLIMAIGVPPGYKRTTDSGMNVFMAWITNLPLQSKGSPVSKWNGQKFMDADSVNGVIDLGVGTQNQKDADIPMQLVIEYLYARGALEDFPIIVGNGDTVTYRKWLNGKYLKDPRMNLIYQKGEKKESNSTEYYRFMEFVMGMTNNKTLVKNLEPVSEKNIMPGDLFIQFMPDDKDSTGHASIIFDVASNDKGDRMYLAGWGGNPPHSLYVARPFPLNRDRWFTLDKLKEELSKYGDGKFYRFAKLGLLDQK